MIIRRIHVTYSLAGVSPDDHETVERVHEFHAHYCPVARSIGGWIDITTEVTYAD